MTDNILKLIKVNGLKFIRFQFTDIFGYLRGVEIPAINISRFLGEGIGVDGSSIGFLTPESSDLRLIPDLTTFRLLPWNKQIGFIICDVRSSDGSELACDPRTILKKQLGKILDIGYKSEVRPEIEYYILDDLSPADDAEYMDLEPFDKFGQLRRKIMDYCLELGIPVKYGHAEVGPGQQEIELGFSDPLLAADQVQLMKQSIRVVADQSDYQATFMPKPLSDTAGNGLHVHQRLLKDGKSIFGENGITDLCKYYIGGLLNYAPNMTAFLNPITNSYQRMVAGYEAPIYLSWGVGNRTALIRVPGYESSVCIEYRGADGAANIYITFALQLEAGILGIKNNLMPPDQTTEDVSKFSTEERKSRNINQLPGSLKTALDKIEENNFIRDVLGEDFIQIFKKRKEKEMKEFTNEKNTDSNWELTKFINYG
ncbi:MAG: glutamine synthetase family protein [Candidatus Hodarchaeales archaeon]